MADPGNGGPDQMNFLKYIIRPKSCCNCLTFFGTGYDLMASKREESGDTPVLSRRKSRKMSYSTHKRHLFGLSLKIAESNCAITVSIS
jgi:hypothetical protein